MDNTRPVEVQRLDGDTTPGLEWLPGRRSDGPADGPQQARTLVIVSGDDGLAELDVARERVAGVDDQRAELIESVLQPKLREVVNGA